MLIFFFDFEFVIEFEIELETKNPPFDHSDFQSKAQDYHSFNFEHYGYFFDLILELEFEF